MFLAGAFGFCSCHPDRMSATVHQIDRADSVTVVPYALVPREARFLTCLIDAGFPSPAADDIEEPVDLAAWLVEHPAASYVMRVSGWSMSGANISDGDHVVVDRSVEPRSGHIVVALVHGDRTMKRLRRRGERLWLLPEPAVGYEFPEILVDEHVELWGVVVGLARRYR
jgi:DNA polymerase V